jgi:non-LEE-encoded effector NleA
VPVQQPTISFIAHASASPFLTAASANGRPAPAHTVIDMPGDDGPDRCVVDIPKDIADIDTTLPIQGLMAALRMPGFRETMAARISPVLEQGSRSRRLLDRFGHFTVFQFALEIPLGPRGVSGKYGVQVNIVKPELRPGNSDFCLQLFPVHDELGFDLPKALGSVIPRNCLPDWCGLSAQIVRNHGFNIPIRRGEGGAGWAVGGADSGAEYLEEWVIRPTELDLKYPGTPMQGTIGLELGMHFKWALSNPACKWAFLTNATANALGGAIGAGAALTSGAFPSLSIQGGAMAAQLVAHGLQYWSNALAPDQVLTWAGATLGPADVNQALPPGADGRITVYPRLWGHVYDGCWRSGDLKQLADKAVSHAVRDATRIAAIENAERGIGGAAAHEIDINANALPVWPESLFTH